MRKKRKHILSWLLTIAMMLSLLPTAAFAAVNYTGETIYGSGESGPRIYKGTYQMVTGTADVTETDVFLGGNYIELGMRPNGAFGTVASVRSDASTPFHSSWVDSSGTTKKGSIGLRFSGSNTWTEGENSQTTDYFLAGGSKDEGYVIGWSTAESDMATWKGRARAYYGGDGGLLASPDHNVTVDGDSIETSHIIEGDGSTTVTATTKTTVTDSANTSDTLGVTQTVKLNENNKYYITDVTLTNKSATNTYYDLSYIRAFNPGQKMGYKSDGNYTGGNTDNYFYKDHQNNVWVIAYGNNTRNLDYPNWWYNYYKNDATHTYIEDVTWADMVTNNTNAQTPFIFFAKPATNGEYAVQAINGNTPYTNYGHFYRDNNNLFAGDDLYGKHYYVDLDIGLEFIVEKLAPGESVTFSWVWALDLDVTNAVDTIREVYNVERPEIKLTVDKAEEKEKTLDVDGKAKDVAGATDTLYYTYTKQEETAASDAANLDSVTADGTQKSLDGTVDLSALAAGTYVFDFWVENDEGIKSNTVQKTITIDDAGAITGDLGADKVTLTYKLTDDDASPTTESVELEKETTLAATPTAPAGVNGEFLGWKCEEDGVLYGAGSTITPTAAMTFVAQWTDSSKTYYDVAVSSTMGGSASGPAKVEENGTVALTAAEEECFVFDHWEYTIGGGSATTSTDANLTLQNVTGNVVAKAFFKPNTTFTATDVDQGILTNVTENIKYSIDNGQTWINTQDDEAQKEITELNKGDVIKVQKQGGGTGKDDSMTQEITVGQADKPTTVDATACTVKENNNGTITGVDDTMQYRLKAGADEEEAAWTDVPDGATTITGLVPGTYEVRVAPEGVNLASEPAEVTVEKYVAPATLVGKTAYTITFEGTPGETYIIYDKNGVEVGRATVATEDSEDGDRAGRGIFEDLKQRGASDSTEQYTIKRSAEDTAGVPAYTSLVNAEEIAEQFKTDANDTTNWNVNLAASENDDRHEQGDNQNVIVTRDPDTGNYRIEVQKDITDNTIQVPDTWEEVTLDLNDKTIKGADATGSTSAQPGMQFVKDEISTIRPGTTLDIVNEPEGTGESKGGKILGGNGSSDGNNKGGGSGVVGAGDAAITNTIKAEAGVTIKGGDGADGTKTSTYGGQGGSGVSEYININNVGGTIKGGDGGDGYSVPEGETGSGGNGGSGGYGAMLYSSSVTISNSGTIEGGNGGKAGDGRTNSDGTGANGGNGGQGGSGTSGGSTLYNSGTITGGEGGDGGNGGDATAENSNGGTGGYGGNGGTGASEEGQNTGTITGGNGGNGGNGGDGTGTGNGGNGSSGGSGGSGTTSSYFYNNDDGTTTGGNGGNGGDGGNAADESGTPGSGGSGGRAGNGYYYNSDGGDTFINGTNGTNGNNGGTVTEGEDYTVTVSSTMGGNASGPAKVGIESSVVLTATNETNFVFDHWEIAIGGITYTPETESDLEMATLSLGGVAGDVVAKAFFKPNTTFTATGEDCGTLTNVTPGMQYSIDGTSWITITEDDIVDSKVTIASGMSAEKDIKVKMPAAEGKSDSLTQTIDVTQGTKPTSSGTACTTEDDNDGTITGVDNTMEYRKKTDGNNEDWTAVGGETITGLVPGEYEVRVKADGTKLASETTTVTVGGYTAAGTWEITAKVADGQSTYGSAAAGSTSVAKDAIDATVTLTATPENGYEFEKWEITGTYSDTDVDLTRSALTLTGIGSAITATAYFKAKAAEPDDSEVKVVGKTAYTITFEGTPGQTYEIYDATGTTKIGEATVASADNGITYDRAGRGIFEDLEQGTTYKIKVNGEMIEVRTSLVNAKEIAERFANENETTNWNVDLNSSTNDDRYEKGNNTNVIVTRDPDTGNYRIDLQQSITGKTIAVPDTWEDVTLDLNNNTIKGANATETSEAQPGMLFVHDASQDTAPGTRLNIVDGKIVGGDGITSNDAAKRKGAAGTVVESGATGIQNTVDTSAQILPGNNGGNPGSSSSGGSSSGGSSSSSTKKTGASFTVNKTDAAGGALSGATFVLTNSKGTEAYAATSDEKGVVRFADVADGSYTLVEKKAPSGYKTSADSYQLTVSNAKVTMDGKDYAAVTFANEKVMLNTEDHFAFLAGYTDGTFGPERNMTRAEVTAMFARLLTEQMDTDKTYSNSFNDVPATHWAANHIGYMEQLGLISGYEDGSFRPNASVSRAEFAAIASRFDKLSESSASFPDVPENHWAAKHINLAATRGWVGGYPDGTFRPNNSITRAEVASVACRMLERSADLDYIKANLSKLRSFSDVLESHWAYKPVMEAANGHDYEKTTGAESWTAITENK